MDERIEKAFTVANYMATLSNQKRIILEEYNQKLILYVNGATFKITPELISFVKTLVDLGNVADVMLVDSNSSPIQIPDLKKFLNDIVSLYFEVTNEFAIKHSEIKNKRKVSDIVNIV